MSGIDNCKSDCQREYHDEIGDLIGCEGSEKIQGSDFQVVFHVAVVLYNLI